MFVFSLTCLCHILVTTFPSLFQDFYKMELFGIRKYSSMFLFFVTVSVAQVIISNIIFAVVSAPKWPWFYMHVHLMVPQDCILTKTFSANVTFKLQQWIVCVAGEVMSSQVFHFFMTSWTCFRVVYFLLVVMQCIFIWQLLSTHTTNKRSLVTVTTRNMVG